MPGCGVVITIARTLSKLSDGASDELTRAPLALPLKLAHLQVYPTANDLQPTVRRDATTPHVGREAVSMTLMTSTGSDAHSRSGTAEGGALGVKKRRTRTSKQKRDKAKTKSSPGAGDDGSTTTTTNHCNDGSLGIDGSGGKDGADGGTVTPPLVVHAVHAVQDRFDKVMCFVLTVSDFFVGIAGAVRTMRSSNAGSLPDGLMAGIGVFDAFFSYLFIVELFVRWKCYRIKRQDCGTLALDGLNTIGLKPLVVVLAVLAAVGEGVKSALARSLRGLRGLRLLLAAEPISKAHTAAFDRTHRGDDRKVQGRCSRTLRRGEGAEPRPGDGGSQALGGGDDSEPGAGLCSTATATTSTTAARRTTIRSVCASLALALLLLTVQQHASGYYHGTSDFQASSACATFFFLSFFFVPVRRCAFVCLHSVTTGAK